MLSINPRKYSIRSGIPNSNITYYSFFFEHFAWERGIRRGLLMRWSLGIWPLSNECILRFELWTSAAQQMPLAHSLTEFTTFDFCHLENGSCTDVCMIRT